MTYKSIVATRRGGLDAVFDGVGGDYLRRGLPLVKRGGVWVAYANPGSKAEMFRLLGRVIRYNLTPNGKAVKLYGTGANRLNRRPFLEDWADKFLLLADGRIRPVIAAEYPILEAAKANALLESGEAVGNVVLVASSMSHASH